MTMHKHPKYTAAAAATSWRRFGGLVIAGFIAKGLVTSSLIVWAVWSAGGH